jgi:uncharacterized protein (TIGR02246 family)
MEMPVGKSRYWLVLSAVAVAVAAAIVASPLIVDVAQAEKPDVSSDLRVRVEAYEQMWNTHRASAVAAFFTEDADMIFGNGPRITGREAIQEWWDAYFARIDATRKGTFAIDSVRMIMPEVALINVASTTGGRGPAGEELPTRLARGTWVLVRHSGEWWISALRGLPAEGDIRVAPGTDR